MSPALTGSADPGLTDDAFLGGRLMLLQPRAGYRAGLDAVLLAAAAPLDGDAFARVLDAGAGTGTVGLCVAWRIPGAEVVLAEREPELAAIAGENARRNGLESRVRVVVADILAKPLAAAAPLADEAFDHVLANPPYHVADRGTRSALPLKDAAHAMAAAGDLERWARFLARMAAPGGSATLIHKAEALPDLLAALAGRFGALRVLPVHPRRGEPASRVVVQGHKGSRAPLALLEGLVLHGEGNSFTPAADAILRHGARLALG